MERRAVRAFAAVILALWLALPAAAAGATSDSAKVYLALGDSLAVGTGATNPAAGGYVPVLFNFFSQPEHGNVDVLTNLAVGGETSGSMISTGQLAAALGAIDDPATNVRVVTLDIGGNDVLRLLRTGSPCVASPPDPAACQALLAAILQTFGTNYPQILAALTEALAADPGNETLLVMTYYNPFSGTGSPLEPLVNMALLGGDGKIDCAADALDATKVGLNDLIACIGSQYGATIVDVYPLFVGKGLALTHIAAGDIHPNDLGHEVIAGAFETAYKPKGFTP